MASRGRMVQKRKAQDSAGRILRMRAVGDNKGIRLDGNGLPLITFTGLSGSTVAKSSTSSSSSSTIASTSATTTPLSQSIVPTSTTSSDVSAATASQANGQAEATTIPTKSKGVSGGAIAGVVIILILILGGLAVFLVRRKMLGKRAHKRAAWSEIVISGPSNFTVVQTGTPSGAAAGVLPPPANAYLAEMGANTITPPVSITITPPPPTVVPGPNPSFKTKTAMVRTTYVPSMPDELTISIGEQLRVYAEYDDGWATCENSQGAMGVVPIECLETGEQKRERMRRASSLKGRRFW